MKTLQWMDKNFEKYFLVVLLAIMTFALGIQIVSRYVFNSSLKWSEELARFILIWMTFISIGYCIRENISLKIDALTTILPTKIRHVVVIAGDSVMAIFFIYLLPSAIHFAYGSFLSGQTSAACQIPMYYVQGSVAFGFALAALRAIEDAYHEAKNYIKEGEKK